jgi:hypothetical protein
MKIQEGRIVFETTRCHSCLFGNPGKVAGKNPCSECQGTGKGKRGKVGGCNKCYGYRTEPDFVNLKECSVCSGSGRVPETITDCIPDEIVKSLPLEIIRTDRRATWQEEYLPIGLLYSCIDYGTLASLDDTRAIEKVRAELHSVQACKVVQDDRLCHALQVIVRTNGYAVQAVL